MHCLTGGSCLDASRSCASVQLCGRGNSLLLTWDGGARSGRRWANDGDTKVKLALPAWKLKYDNKQDTTTKENNAGGRARLGEAHVFFARRWLILSVVRVKDGSGYCMDSYG